MRSCFSAQGLGTVLLMTFGAVLLQWPAHAQTIGPLQETWDGGKTWAPEGTGRPNRRTAPNVSPAPSIPSISPEEAARRQAQAEERRRRHTGYAANEDGLKYAKEENWEAAVQAFEKALQNWDDEGIRHNLARAKEEARLQRERIQEEQQRQRRDAAASANLRQSVDRLATVLSNQSATGNFDSATTGTPRSGGGLDFITDPATVLSRPVGSHTPEPHTDPQVVDLRDAKTFTVDPAKVQGPATTPIPPQQLEFLPLSTADASSNPHKNPQNGADPASEKFSKAAGEALRASLIAKQTGNPHTQAEADKRLQQLSQAELQRLARQQAEAHQEMLEDMRILRGNGDQFVRALEDAKARVRAKELAALKAADAQHHKDSSAYLRRLMGNEMHMKPEEVEAINERRRAAHAGALKQAYDAMAAEVQRLKKQLLADTNGLPIFPPSDIKDLELLFAAPLPR